MVAGVIDLEAVEDLSETVANRLIEFSDALRRRDFDRAASYLAGDFLGTRFSELAESGTDELPLGARRVRYSVEGARAEPVDPPSFVASLQRVVASLEAIDHVFFKTRGAEFETSGERGVLRMTANIIGRLEGGRPWSLYGWAQAEVRLANGSWVLRRFVLERLEATTRDTSVFTDVAAAAGLARVGARLGTPGNSNFYWRGAAASDFDGDGLFDIFTSTSDRNLLFRNAGDGTFVDVTERAGLLGPAGVTGPLFLDFDRDGDQDLFCAHVGWTVDGVPSGNPLKLFRNDGDGRYTDVSAETGLGAMHTPAFSAAAADVDGDGWLDIYVASYNRLDVVYPNSWFQATNGTPNLLLLNRQGKRFEDAAAVAGVAGTAWSYAAAFADYDEDGDQDLYVANDYGDNALYRNRGDGTFEDVAALLGVVDTGNGMGVAWGDLDNDGRLDLYVSNMSSSAGNRILTRLASGVASAGGAAGSTAQRQGSASSRATAPSGEGVSSTHQTLVKLAAGNSVFLQRDGGFERLPASHGGIGASWAWSASLLDIDLDGTLDVYVANGFISGDSLKDT